MSKEMLSTIGLLLVVAGTIITAIATTKYQGQTIEKQEKIQELSEKNQELSNQILGLSNRISEQSKFIENQITGGDSFGYSKLLAFTDNQGQKGFKLEVYNDFESPIKQLQFFFTNINDLNSKCFIEKNGKTFLIESCVTKLRKVTNVGDIPPKSKFQISSISIPEKTISDKYIAEYMARNGRYVQKILVNKKNNVVIGFAYRITKDKEIIKEFIDGKFEKEKINFEDGFEYVDKKFSYLQN